MADITQTTETILKMNGQQASETMQGLRKRADELRQSIAKAMAEGDTKGAKQLQRTLNGVNREIKAIQASSVMVEHTLKNLDKAAPNDLKKTLQVLERQLQGMDRGSAIWKKQIEDIKRVKAELKVVNDELAVHETFMQRLKRNFIDFGHSILAGAASITGIVMAGKKAVQMYAEMDQEMANVRKYTGMTSEQVEHLNEAFKQMDTRSSRDQLNKLAQEAGRLGMSSEEDVLGFVKAADKINVALDELGEGATLTLSKLTDIFGDKQRLGVEKSLLSVGSVINELSQNSTASASYLATFAQRMAGVGAQANMTVPQIMGFGAVLDSQGQQVEMSASALSKLVMNLFKQADKIAAATGLNLQKFKETAAKDTNEALIMLLERLHELGNMDALAPMFKEMGENGVRSSQVLAALAGNIDLVKQQQEAANVAFEEGVSIDKEFEVQNTTVQAKLEKARKGFQEMAVTLGQELMPIVSHLISGTSATMRVLLKTIQFVKEYKGEILGLATGIAVYTIATEAATIKTKLHNAAVAIATTAQKAWNSAIKANPWAAALAVIFAVTTAIAAHIKKVNEATIAEKAEADARKKISEQYSEQRAKIDMLNAAVHNETMSLNNRREALKKLQELIPDYHASLTDEGKLINDNKEAIDHYIESVQREIELQVYREKLEELYRKRMTAEENVAKTKSSYETAQANLDEHGNEVQIRTSMGAAGPTGGAVNSYVVAANQARQNFVAAKNELNEIDAAILKIGSHIKDTPNLFGTTPTTPEEEDAGGSTGQPSKADDWNARQVALANIAYATGETQHEEYQRKLLEIDVEYRKLKLKEYEQGTTDYLKAVADEAQAEAKLKAFDTKQQEKIDKEALKKRLAEENNAYEDIRIALQQRYADGEIDNATYQRAMEEAELQHLDRIRKMYEEGSVEQLKAERDYQKASLRIQQKRQQEAERMRDSLEGKFFADFMKGDPAEYQMLMDNLDVVYQKLLDEEGITAQQRIDIERSYQEAKLALALQYNQEIADDQISTAQVVAAKMKKFFNSKKFQDTWKGVGMVMNKVGSLASGISELVQTECDNQVAAIEAKYDKEIKAAGNNSARVTQLEKQKADETAAIKAEANRKTFAINIATAIMDAAMASVEAWMSAMELPFPANVAVGAVLTALVAAETGVQIATMKKQQEAAATGYAKGRKGGKAEFALIGEKGPEMMYIPDGASIVPNNKLQSPQDWGQYGVPTAFSPLDEVRRTNTIGTLGRRDVSRSITAQQVIAETTAGGSLQAGMAAQVASNSETAKTLERLNKRLDEPLVAVTTITGDKGIKRAQDRYEQLQRNVKSKTR